MKVFAAEMKKFESLPLVKKVNSRGMISAIIFEKAEDATAIVKDAISQGVLPVCTNRNSIKIAPPLTIPPYALREALGVLRVCVARRNIK